MVIRSYRRAFRYERRLYKVYGTEWDVPGHPTVLSIVYGAVLIAAIYLLGWLPITSVVFGNLDWPIKLAIPVLLAMWLSTSNFDGRRGHDFVRDWLGYKWRNRPRWNRQPSGEVKIPVVPDIDSPELTRGVLSGPGSMQFYTPVTLTTRHGKQVIKADDEGHESTFVLFPRETVEVHG